MKVNEENDDLKIQQNEILRLIWLKGKLKANLRNENLEEATQNLKELKQECESDYELIEQEIEIQIRLKDYQKAKKIFKLNEYNLKLY